MDNIYAVFQTCISFLNTRLSFAPFSFTIMQYLLALFIGYIVVDFVHSLFS